MEQILLISSPCSGAALMIENIHGYSLQAFIDYILYHYRQGSLTSLFLFIEQMYAN